MDSAKSDWEENVSARGKARAKIYPLGNKDREVVDETFDKLQSQGRLEYTKNRTPFGYPVFVIWKTTNGERKGRAVVNIRGLNDLTLPNAYPLPLQADVITSIRNCPFITVIDAASFIYQWRAQIDCSEPSRPGNI